MAAFEAKLEKIKNAVNAARTIIEDPFCNADNIATVTNSRIASLNELTEEKDRIITELEAGPNTFRVASFEEIATAVPEPQDGYSCSIITEVDGELVYDATYVYSAVKNEWVRMLPGMTLSAVNVLTGTEYKADSGMVTGTLGDDMTTTTNLGKIGTLFQTMTGEYWDINLDVTAQELFTMINPGDGLSALYRLIDWSKYVDFSNFMILKDQITSLDLSWTRPIAAQVVTGFCKGCAGLTTVLIPTMELSAATSYDAFLMDCSSLTKLDISGTTFNAEATTADMLLNVPANCEIIVKDEVAKQFLLGVRNDLTNVIIKGGE
jgi:hypothetical protein